MIFNQFSSKRLFHPVVLHLSIHETLNIVYMFTSLEKLEESCYLQVTPIVYDFWTFLGHVCIFIVLSFSYILCTSKIVLLIPYQNIEKGMLFIIVKYQKCCLLLQDSRGPAIAQFLEFPLSPLVIVEKSEMLLDIVDTNLSPKYWASCWVGNSTVQFKFLHSMAFWPCCLQ